MRKWRQFLINEAWEGNEPVDAQHALLVSVLLARKVRERNKRDG